MILYQIAKSMEERARLDRTIRDSHGDVRELIDEKSMLEQQVLSQASKWREAEPTVFA